MAGLEPLPGRAEGEIVTSVKILQQWQQFRAVRGPFGAVYNRLVATDEVKRTGSVSKSKPPAQRPAGPPAPSGQAAARTAGKPPAEEHRTQLRTFNRNFERYDTANGDKADGVVSKDDLEKRAGEGDSTARYLLDNPDRLRSLDDAAAQEKDGDGRISRDDLDASLTSANREVRDSAPDGAGRAAREQVNGLANLERDWNALAKDGKLSRSSLEEAARNPSATSEQRASAQYLLDNPERLAALDTAAQGGDADGGISRDDLKAGRIDAFNELRTNPDAQRLQEIERQQGRVWDNPQDALTNLKANGDLSTYSKDQLLVLNLLASQDPEARGAIQDATAAYVNERTRKFADIPDEFGFQRLLQDQVVKAGDGSPESVEEARDRLQGQVKDEMVRATLAQLEDKKGDDAADEAVNRFATEDVKKMAERNPALVSLFEEGAQKAFEDPKLLERIKSVKEADDNLLTKAIRGTGNLAGDVVGKVADFALDTSPLGLAGKGLDAVGLDAPANFIDDVHGGVSESLKGTVTGVTDFGAQLSEHPLETARGLSDLALNFGPLAPLNDLKQMALDGKSPQEISEHKAELGKGVWDSLTASYKATGQEHGTAGAVSHLATDIALTAFSGGAAGAVKGGLKGTAIAERLSNLSAVSRLQTLATTGRTGEVLSQAGRFADEASLASTLDNLSPGVRGLAEVVLSNAQDAAWKQTQQPERPEVG